MPRIVRTTYLIRVNRGNYQHEEFSCEAVEDVGEQGGVLAPDDAIKKGVELFRVAKKAALISSAESKKFFEGKKEGGG